MSVSRLHAVDTASQAPAITDGSGTDAATTGDQRRERRRARQATTRSESGDLLREAMSLAGVSRQQFADWIGVAKSNLDLILSGDKSLAADDLLTSHPGVRRVAAIYLRLLAAHVDGGKAAAGDVPVRERATLAVEALGDLLRAERVAMQDGQLDAGERRELDGLCTRVIEIGTAMRETIRGGR